MFGNIQTDKTELKIKEYALSLIHISEHTRKY